MNCPSRSILEAIGNTPLVKLDRLTNHYGCDGTILAKLDHLNPGFSKKDRAALGVIEAAERDGAANEAGDGESRPCDARASG